MKILDQLPPDGRSGKRYPWREMLDGQPREIQRGEDFSCKLDAMTRQIYAQAERMRLIVEVRVDRDREAIAFQAVRPPRKSV